MKGSEILPQIWGGKVLLADLDKKMLLPRDQMLCSDGVHLTAPAYDRMAKTIYDTIKDSV